MPSKTRSLTITYQVGTHFNLILSKKPPYVRITRIEVKNAPMVVTPGTFVNFLEPDKGETIAVRVVPC